MRRVNLLSFPSHSSLGVVVAVLHFNDALGVFGSKIVVDDDFEDELGTVSIQFRHDI